MSRVGKHVNPAMVLALVALVFAVTGGAYAASGGGGNGGHVSAQASKSKKKASSGKPGPRGPVGPQGPAGPAGLAGPAGAAGVKGADGAAGAPGEAGVAGSNGVSATAVPYSGAECAQGGAEVKSASAPVFVCNGENGTTGFTKVLPVGQSEEGTWVAAGPAEGHVLGGTWAPTSISFGIPLETAPKVHIVRAGTAAGSDPEGCEGTVAAPKAEPGNLCVFVKIERNVRPDNPSEFEFGYNTYSPETGESEKAGRSGLVFGPSPEKSTEDVFAMGVWVVTAE